MELPLPRFVPRRYRPGNLGTWSGHLAFANDLISAIRPSLIVELGTHFGEAYFTFCQSVVENGISCLCYAVDHWLGEAHAGQYGEEVIQEVSHYNESNYKGFSYLLRTNFDDALSQFADESIGLLHLDGLHTYEAVSHDFWAWWPKVRSGGIVLLHDIVVRHADFGVWRLWDELRSQFPESFAFNHSWGLGVLRKPAGSAEHTPYLDTLFNSAPAAAENIRRHYTLYAAYLENMLHEDETNASPLVHVQVFPFRNGEYSEELKAEQTLEFGERKTLKFEFPEGIGTGPLRIDPADCPSVVELAKVAVISQASGDTLWSAGTPAALRNLTPSGSATLLAQDGSYLLFSYGTDPQLVLPELPEGTGAVSVEISLRVDREFQAVVAALEARQQTTRAQMERSRARDDGDRATVHAEITSAQAERMLVAAELSQMAAERNEARRELKRAEQMIEAARLRALEQASEKESLRESFEAKRASFETEFAALRNSYEAKLAALRSSSEAELTALRSSSEAELRNATDALRSSSEADLSALRSSSQAELAAVRNALEAEISALRDSLESERAVRTGIEHSLSWRVTQPVRSLMHFVRTTLGMRS